MPLRSSSMPPLGACCTCSRSDELSVVVELNPATEIKVSQKAKGTQLHLPVCEGLCWQSREISSSLPPFQACKHTDYPTGGDILGVAC